MSIVGRTVIPPSAGRPRAVRELQVTGSHAVFSGATETVDITGSPRVQLTDSRLRQPAVVSGARLIHVNLRTRDFDAVGSASHQVTGVFELASPSPDGSGDGSGIQ
ncbi:MAG: hypothetical protein LC772_11215 [Chloroflexi bacterium]|nr:hypothetical protein [Chloroflexota bacterium]